MRNVFLFILTLGISQCAFSQNYNHSNGNTFFHEHRTDPYDVPTPNQSDLGRYGVIPVSPYTGKADITVPIYNTTQRGVELNIFLSYDTSGLLINQLPGWTGHNWTLSAGGAITRKINGRPDEINFKGTNAGTDYFIAFYKNSNDINSYEVMSNGVYHYPLAYPEYDDYVFRRNMIIGNNLAEIDKYSNFSNYFTLAQNNRNLNGYVVIPDSDTCADIFYFNFLGFSGSFFYGNDGNWKIKCDQNLDVIFDVNDSTNYIDCFEEYIQYNSAVEDLCVRQPKTIKGFTIVDEAGNRYIFGGDKTKIEYSMSLTGKVIVNTTEPWSAVSWMLKEVQDRFGNTLYSFNYSRGEFITQLHNSYNSVKSTAKYENSTTPVHRTPKACSATLSAPVYLDEINIIDGTRIDFRHSRAFAGNASSILYPNGVDIQSMLKATYKRLTYNEDPNAPFDISDNIHYLYCSLIYSNDSCLHYIQRMNLEKLKSIHIGRGNSINPNISEKVFTFLYDFDKRMHLKSLLYSCGEQTAYSYNFEYDRFNLLPSDYLTKKFDHWGYYNGIDYDRDSNEVIVPLSGGVQIGGGYVNHVGMSPRAARISDIELGTMGMLKKITYPTGGYSIINYEQNSCSKYMSDDKQSVISLTANLPVGGLRIKSIENYDNNVLIGRKSYSYEFPDSHLSSGELYTIPNTHYEWEDDRHIYEMDVACSIVPLSNSFAPTVGYSYVTETEMDGTSTTYTFTNFSTEKDSIYNNIRFNTITPFDETSCRQYMCGKLLSETKADSQGNPIYQKQCTYTSDQEYNSTNYVTTTSYLFHDIIGNVGNIYKLFYFKTGLKSEVSSTKYGNSWVTDSVTYDRRYHTLYVNGTSGQSHNVDICKTMSETIKRGENTLRVEYSFPFMEQGIQSNLVSQFCLPVTSVKRYLDGVLMDGTKTTYHEVSNRIVPEYEFHHKSDTTVHDNRVHYSSYTPTFRPQEIIDKNNISHRLFWNNHDQLIASVSNGPNINIPSENADAIIAANSSSVFASKPIDTNIYEYDDYGRVSRIVSGNGRSTHYGYDLFDRLQSIYDTHHKKVKSFNYHYRPNNDVVSLYTLSSAGIDYYGVIENVLYINYHLPYEFEHAELKVIHIYSGTIKENIILQDNPTTNQIQIPITNSYVSGYYKICLYVDGVEKDDKRFAIQ